MALTDFSPKRAAETVILTVDFVNLMTAGSVIVHADWVNTVTFGIDPNVNLTTIGVPTFSGTRVSHLVTGGVVGVVYTPRVTIKTDDDQVFILPDPGTGALAINHA